MTTEMKAFKELAAKSTQRPYYVGPDYAGECPPHNNSGLALIETGRAEDWPCARLCEWPTAAFLALAANYVERLVERLQVAIEMCYCPDGGCSSCTDSKALLAEIEEAAKGNA